MARSPIRPIKLQPKSKAFEDAVDTGRLIGFPIDADCTNILTAILYGWTGASQDTPAAARTNDLIAIVRQEILQHPHTLQIIAGDINGAVEDFAALQNIIEEEAWADLGAHADRCGGQPDEPTCHTNAEASQSRCDYILVNQQLLPPSRPH